MRIPLIMLLLTITCSANCKTEIPLLLGKIKAQGEKLSEDELSKAMTRAYECVTITPKDSFDLHDLGMRQLWSRDTLRVEIRQMKTDYDRNQPQMAALSQSYEEALAENRKLVADYNRLVDNYNKLLVTARQLAITMPRDVYVPTYIPIPSSPPPQNIYCTAIETGPGMSTVRCR